MLFSPKLTLFIVCAFWLHIQGLKVIPERATVPLMNTHYVRSAVMNVRRYDRKSPYYINLYGFLEHQWNNNITVDIIFSEFLHNEYRRSFIEMHYKLCDLINKEPFIGGMLKLAGLDCPLSEGAHYLSNMSAPTGNFKNVFPFEKGRIDATLSLTATKEPVLQLSLECLFKN